MDHSILSLVSPMAYISPGAVYLLGTKGPAAVLVTGDPDLSWSSRYQLTTGAYSASIVTATRPVLAGEVYWQAINRGAPKDGVGLFLTNVPAQDVAIAFKGQDLAKKFEDMGTGFVSGVADVIGDVGAGVANTAAFLPYVPYIVAGLAILGVVAVMIYAVRQ